MTMRYGLLLIQCVLSLNVINCHGQKSKYNKLEIFLKDSCQTSSLMVLKKGEPIYEYGDTKEVSYLASCRKSVLALLYGPFVENGTINLNENLQDLGMDDKGGLLDIEKEATINNILQSRSGVYHKAANSGDATDKAPQRGTVKPGSLWLYNNWDFNIAGAILEKKTGKNIYVLMDSQLAKPLGFEDWSISNQRKFDDSKESLYPAYHMFLSTCDMAKIGQLMMQKGKWNGDQIISKKWIEKITSIITSNAEAQKTGLAWYDFAYGYYWWIWDKPFKNKSFKWAYTASGAFGQFITVIPRLNLVIAHKTVYPSNRNTTPEQYFKILDKILKVEK